MKDVRIHNIHIHLAYHIQRNIITSARHILLKPHIYQDQYSIVYYIPNFIIMGMAWSLSRICAILPINNYRVSNCKMTGVLIKQLSVQVH